MTPKEKAEELVDRYDETLTYLESKSKAKKCALIAVDEILNHHSQEQGLYRIDTYYWIKVQEEIEKL
jgi:hypothetical protein